MNVTSQADSSIRIHFSNRAPIIALANQSFVSCLLLVALVAGVALAQGKKTPPAKPIDLNAATIKELEELPGVGPVMAQRIIEARQKSGRFRRGSAQSAWKNCGLTSQFLLRLLERNNVAGADGSSRHGRNSNPRSN